MSLEESHARRDMGHYAHTMNGGTSLVFIIACSHAVYIPESPPVIDAVNACVPGA